MANPKFVDGMIEYVLKTFDGTYVKNKMSEAEAKVMLSDAKTDGSMPGYELRNGNYYFATEEVEMKLGRSKREKTDEI